MPKLIDVGTRELTAMQREQRKFGTKIYSVTASAIRREGSSVGRVVILTRDAKTGELVDRMVRSLPEVLESGIPVPNLLEISLKP